MDPGRVHAFVAANRAGHVVYERFYDRLSEAAKAEARAAMHAAAQQSPLVELQDYVGWHKGACFVFVASSDLVLYLMGSGQYDELALATVLFALLNAFRDVTGRPANEAVLLDHYASLALVLDEAIVEGIVETTDKERIRKGTKNKAVWQS